MIWILGHPPFERLSRFADGELDNARRARVAAHLASCERCRDTIRFIHELGEAARNLPAPEPPADVVPRFLARRAAGVRVILPTSDPIPLEPERRRTLPAAIAASIALFVAGALLVSVPRLNADRGRLTFAPEKPRAGAHIEVAYVSGAQFRSESSLVLRGRYRYENGKDEIREIARLARNDDGTFRGDFTLPDSVVYAVFAVEDSAARHVDSNTRRFWELLVHDEDGKPLFLALRERVNERFGRNWESAYEAAVAMTDLYPDRVESWYTRYSFDVSWKGAAGRDSVVSAHRAILARFDEKYQAVEPPADEISTLVLYAMALADTRVAERWKLELVSKAPKHPIAVQLRIADLLAQYRSTPNTLIAALEELWVRAEAQDRDVAAAGFRAALMSGDSASILRWADRYAQADPFQAVSIAGLLAEDARLRHAGIERLKRLSASIESITPRRLSANSARHKLHLARELAAVQTEYGQALLAAANTREGLNALVEAAHLTWNPKIFRTVADAFVAAGDTVAAVPYFARWAVDPTTSPITADSLAELAVGSVGWDTWLDERRNAHAEMLGRVHAESIWKSIADDIELLGPDGRPVELGTLLAGQPAVVALWSCMCGPALESAREFAATIPTLEAHGVKTIVIATRSLSGEALPEPAPVTLDIPIYSDRFGKVVDAFGQWNSFQLFIVDSAGVVRFDEVRVDEALRYATAFGPSRLTEVVVAP